MIKYPKDLLEEIQVHLEEEKKRIESQISDLTSQDPFSDIDRLTDNAATDTEAKEEINHERYQAMLSQLKNKVSDIDIALMRIKKGDYGFCEKCSEMIDTDRLGAIPTARLCMKCEAKK